MISLNMLSSVLLSCSFPIGVAGTAPEGNFEPFYPDESKETFRLWIETARAEKIDEQKGNLPLIVMVGEDQITFVTPYEEAKYPMFWTIFAENNDTSKPMHAIRSIHHKPGPVRSYQYTGTCRMIDDPESD
ncbi:hypothetical protein [Parvularcula sp. LCG005]|uniref:hypothetical protein n=1 Tax=Parvularcula sp. LCG005 TaxID=3078805 RepID=UPI0029429FA8|nr:hypothetical protein [Parvularcula sp. LCG005]WOI53337.1 hypothetical protein RUI03_14425 [Parvularcula sp. LCG005]